MHQLESTIIALAEPQGISTEVLIEKYAKGDETTINQLITRVSRALAEIEPAKSHKKHADDFLWAIQNGFIPAGRVFSAAGTGLRTTLINCFVQPVGDSITEDVGGKRGIYTALAQAAETMRRGGGVGYNFSAIRPKGAQGKGTGSSASGPISYMKVFDRSCETVEAAGARRGAQMAVLNVDHPDILDFITVKQEKGQLNNFNISVGVTDAFMRAVEADEDVELAHATEPNADIKSKGAYRRDDGKWVYRKIKARTIWDLVMQSTYNAAEPGVLYLDRINRENNLAYCETIEATNPCGEQPLPDYGGCCLGSLNLNAYVTAPFTDAAKFDFELLAKVTKIGVRMLDNVLIATKWPLPEQAREADAKRRLGLGFTGLGDALIMLGVRYDSEEGCALAADIARTMRDAAYESSVELAQERGAFPLFDADQYLSAGFASRLPEGLKAKIRKHGIRNSHLTSIAPTGTISLAFADNASNGIEPVFSWFYNRSKRMPDGSKKDYTVEDHAYRVYRALGRDTGKLPEAFVSALDISATDHMLMVAAVAPCIDAAISKTVNVPEDYPYDDFKDLYMEAWHKGLKGIATYRPNSVLGAVLSVSAADTAPQPMTLSEQDKRLVLDALFAPHEPKTGTDGTLAWVADVCNPSTDDDFVLMLKELQMPDGTRRPYSMWLTGGHPHTLDGLCKLLSHDMRVVDPAWIGMKLRKLLNYAEPRGDFLARIPGSEKQASYPSTVAYIAQLVIHRYAMLGILTEQGMPVKAMGVVTDEPMHPARAVPAMHGKLCRECGNSTVIKKDGCELYRLRGDWGLRVMMGR